MCSLMHVMCAVNVCHMCAICVQQMCDIQMDVCRKNAHKKKLDGRQTRAKYVGTVYAQTNARAFISLRVMESRVFA